MAEPLSNSTGAPQEDVTSRILLESSFFRQDPARALPSPAEVRARNATAGHRRATALQRPCPVSFPDIGVFVKYGSEVSVMEAETQAFLHHELSGRVPTPEVFGWLQDGGQTFIYSAFIQDDTLQSRLTGMNEDERTSICQQLRPMVDAWRSIRQDASDPFVGGVGKRPLIDVFFEDHQGSTGPFLGTDAVQAFHENFDIGIDGPLPIFLTHNDLCPPNILISSGDNPTVVAIVDWGQSGWYPAYWEYCKAFRVGSMDGSISSELQKEWHTRYLTMVIDPVDDELYYHPWLWFMLSHL